MSDNKKTGRYARPETPGAGGRGHGPGRGMGPKQRPKNIRGTLGRLVGYLKGHLGRMGIVLLFAAVSAGVTVVGTQLVSYAIDNFIAAANMEGLLSIIGILLAVYLVSIICQYLQNILMVRISMRITTRIRMDLFDKMEDIRLQYYDTHNSGDLMSRLTNDVDNIGNTLSQSVTQLFSGAITVISVLVAMILLNGWLTLIAMVTIPLTLLGSRSVMRISRRAFSQRQKDLGEVNGYVEEFISGQKTIKIFNREAYVQEGFDQLNEELRRSGTKAESVSGIMGPMMNAINNFTYLLVTVAGSVIIISSGGASLTAGNVFAFLTYMKNFGRPLNEAANLMNSILSALAGAERVFAVMDETKEEDAPGALELQDIRGDIAFENVTFSYEEGKPVMKGVSLTAYPGEQVAIVGPTGAGKTTIISLLTRFYDIDSGRITIDGYDLRDLKRDSVRRHVGMVLQDTFLFAETVRENIRYGRPDATDEEVEAAAKMANAHSFIIHMPQGYDTILGDNAGELSQGQRQLLSIARVILFNPSVLILDEATSSIDTRTELKIQEAMLKLMEGRTSFIIAHRLSTIKNADKILVINKGEVVEQGTHQELLDRDGFYAGLYNSQFKTGMAL